MTRTTVLAPPTPQGVSEATEAPLPQVAVSSFNYPLRRFRIDVATATATAMDAMNRWRATDTWMLLSEYYRSATARRLIGVVSLPVPAGERAASRGWRRRPVPGDMAEAVR